MLEFFNNHIKIMNDQLGKDLGIVNVNVYHVPTTHHVEVYTKVGNKRMKVSEKKFYRALGLRV